MSWDRTCAESALILAITWHELGGVGITALVQSGDRLSHIHDLSPWATADCIVEYTTYPSC
jgi:hypothetical protein